MEEEVKEIQERLESTIENVDEQVLVEFVSGKINYEFGKSFLVKQLDAIQVDKSIKVPVPTGEKDDEGNDITEMQDETVKVDSVLRIGIILKVPTSLTKLNDETYKIGDRIVYRNMRATDFDLVKDTVLVDPFDVICKQV